MTDPNKLTLATGVPALGEPRWDHRMKWRDIPLALLGMLFGRERKEIPACLVQWVGVAAILLSGRSFTPDWPALPAVGAGLLVLGVILIFVLGGLGPIPCLAMVIVMPPFLIAMAFEPKPKEEDQESQQSHAEPTSEPARCAAPEEADA